MHGHEVVKRVIVKRLASEGPPLVESHTHLVARQRQRALTNHAARRANVDSAHVTLGGRDARVQIEPELRARHRFRASTVQ